MLTAMVRINLSLTWDSLAAIFSEKADLIVSFFSFCLCVCVFFFFLLFFLLLSFQIWYLDQDVETDCISS